MLKKILITGTLGLASAVAVVGTGIWSYVETGVHHAGDSVRNSVPVEWEIERARQMIEKLQPEIEQNMLTVTREGVEIRKLTEQVTAKTELLAKSESEILRLKDDLGTGNVRFVYKKRTYSADDVEEELARRFRKHLAHKANTDKLEKILFAREKNLTAATEQLDQMLSAKRELEVQIEDLQARLTLVDVAQTANNVTIDDSLLSNTRQLLDEISTKIEVKEQLVASKGALEGNIQLDDPAAPELMDEIADYFQQSDTEAKTLLSSHEL